MPVLKSKFQEGITGPEEANMGIVLCSLACYVPPPKVMGDILVSVRIPGVGMGVTVWYPPYLLNQWVEFYQTCMDT